jgi:hypothetical protein
MVFKVTKILGVNKIVEQALNIPIYRDFSGERRNHRYVCLKRKLL